MGPAGGGRSFLSQRFQRHFNLLTYTELEDYSIKTIFNTIVKFFLNPFKDEIKECSEDIINCTLKLYKDIRLSMLPTPKKMHYLFNLRDMSKVLQGVCSASKNHATKKVDIVRLWIHEMQRVFGDRLINDEDRMWMKTKLDDEVSQIFKLTLEETYNTGKRIIFCDFSQGTDSSPRPYIQVNDIDMFKKKIEIELENYNSDGKKKPLKLVMFLDACDHVSRISRVLRQPQGNALLLGVGGSGRQSLARLATYINKYECYQIEVIKGYSVSEFLKNVKECLKQAGIQQLSTTFLIADTQIIHKIMLEYINNVLNSGDIPNLYKNEDYEAIRDKCKSDCQLKYGALTETNLFKTYLSRVIRNLHIVLAMSPVGDAFVQRLRMFPSLVNCCTIDWFTEWPEDALESVANDALTQNDMELGDYFNGCVNAFKFIHKRVEKMSVTFSQELRRFIYLTPTSYLELLNIYQTLLKEKRKETNKKIERLVNGLKVLDSAGESVKNMQEIIKDTKPKLLIRSEKNAILVKDLIEKKSKAEVEQAMANEKSIAATKKDTECTELLNKAQTELDRVQPLIDKALAAVKAIEKNDLDQIKNFKVLNPSVEPVMEALLIFMLGPNSWKTKEFKVPDGQGKNPFNIKDVLMKKLGFSDTEGFKEGLASICASKESLNQIKTPEKVEHLSKAKEFIVEKAITEETAKRGSGAAVGIYNFMTLLIQYVENSIAIIDPLQKLVIEATLQKDQAMEDKRQAVETADIASRTVEELTRNHEAARAEEEKLKLELTEAEEKLERANVLITLLSGEKTRWEEQVKSLKVDYNNLIGDCLIAAGSVSYSGPFTFKYRSQLENDWRDKIKELDIVHSSGITMQRALRDDILVREWTVNGLQQDDLSIENGIFKV
jgi:dynein heavy chain